MIMVVVAQSLRIPMNPEHLLPGVLFDGRASVFPTHVSHGGRTDRSVSVS